MAEFRMPSLGADMDAGHAGRVAGQARRRRAPRRHRGGRGHRQGARSRSRSSTTAWSPSCSSSRADGAGRHAAGPLGGRSRRRPGAARPSRRPPLPAAAPRRRPAAAPGPSPVARHRAAELGARPGRARRHRRPRRGDPPGRRAAGAARSRRTRRARDPTRAAATGAAARHPRPTPAVAPRPARGAGVAVRPPAGGRARRRPGRPRSRADGGHDPRRGRASRRGAPRPRPARPGAGSRRRRAPPAPRPAPGRRTARPTCAGPSRALMSRSKPRDPALLPDHHLDLAAALRLAARAQPRPRRRPTGWCPRRCCSRRRRWPPAASRSSTGFWVDDALPAQRAVHLGRRGLPARRRPGRPGACTTPTTCRSRADGPAARPGHPGARRPAARLGAERPDHHRHQPRRPGGRDRPRRDLPAPGRPRRLRPGHRAAVGGRRAARRATLP